MAKWEPQRVAVDIATLGGAELPMGDMLNLRGMDETAYMGNLADVSQPFYTGNPAAWEFLGGDQGQYYRNLYNQGALGAAGRTPEQIQAEQMATAQQEQFRQQQMDTLAQLQQQAAGNGPMSAAEQMALAQGDATKRMAQAQALSARGATGSSALRAATETQARAGISAEQQQQLIRTQEQQQAQQQLGALAGQIRGQDLGLATTQAGLTQQAAIANQQAGLEQQSMNDQLVQFYTNMGMSLDQAQLQAQQAYQQMLSDIVQSQYNAQAGIIASGLQDRASQQAAQMAAAGTIAYGAAQAYGSSNPQSSGSSGSAGGAK